MKWEAVKLEVARQVFTHITNGCNATTLALILRDLMVSNYDAARGKTSSDMLRSYADKAYDAVMAWDVRSCSSLRRLFPDYFPSRLRNGNLTAYMEDNANCDWMIAKL